ncbi:YhcN/YlaJ family sporulation lipoprotein [Oceanobacillus sp. FSL K6-2867]|uniref:YhcN/YlaJ family sporulation lipoprotein n=1 Tax=Oceanobacillus sp. FSL K6-2867 TaxID=2954748 RepID=UPI0030DCFA27
MKAILVIMLMMTSILVGCTTFDNSEGEREEILDELDPTRNTPEPTDDELSSKLGYVRYTKDQLNNETENSEQQLTIDRNEMADMITKIILRNDGFEEVATLVTDKEVLIAYQRNEDLSAEEAANVSKKTAVSIMPGYFNIHVSDNETLMQDIQSLHRSTSENRNYDNTINAIIKEMEKTPNIDAVE